MSDISFILPALFDAAATTEAATEAASGVSGGVAMLIQFLPFVLVLVVFYFLFMLPQKKKEKATQKMRNELQIGDEVITIGGIVGIVVKREPNEETVVIETGGDRSKIRVKVWAIQENLTIHDTPES